MEFFDSNCKAVKLRSHLDKYLVADADGETVRQSRRSANSPNARWTIEAVKGKENVIRLKSCHGSYLMASDTPFLLGVTGKKALLMTPPDTELLPDRATAIEWEPIRDGFQVRLKTWGGKYLTANGGMPPWRNSITLDDPRSGAMHNWILWDVEEAQEKDVWRKGTESALEQYLSSMSSFSSVSDDILSAFGSESGSPRTAAAARMSSPRKYSSMSPDHEMSSDDESQSGMDFFRNAKAVRLRSRHGKYLVASDDLVSVSQNRSGAAANARWTVEFVHDSDSIIRLKSCCGKYLTASDDPYPLRMTGFKVQQTKPTKLDSSVEWEPIREGDRVKLRTRYGNFLRGNGSVPPWRNSVTHDIPRRTATRNWVLWEVQVVDVEAPIHGFAPLGQPQVVEPEPFSSYSTSEDSGSLSSVLDTSPSSVSDRSFCLQEAIGPFMQSTLPSEGRTVYYHIADENGEVDGEDLQGFTLNFKGSSVSELTRVLERETGIPEAVVCSRSPLNGKLCPLRLQLPPNVVMHVVVAPSSFTEQGVL